MKAIYEPETYACIHGYLQPLSGKMDPGHHVLRSPRHRSHLGYSTPCIPPFRGTREKAGCTGEFPVLAIPARGLSRPGLKW